MTERFEIEKPAAAVGLARVSARAEWRWGQLRPILALAGAVVLVLVVAMAGRILFLEATSPDPSVERLGVAFGALVPIGVVWIGLGRRRE